MNGALAGLCVLAVGIGGMACASGAEPEGAARITVLAAASLTDALTEIGAAFEAESGVPVDFSFGGSDTLAGQVINGAPADAVVFAGPSPMDRLEAAGLVQAGGRRDFASNQLVVITGKENQRRLSSLDDLVSAYPGLIAIADPQLAPAGRYARQAMEGAGIRDALADRLLPTGDVRAAAAAVASGNAGFGFVYVTDAAAFPGVTVAYEVPANLYPRIAYPAAVVVSSNAPEAAASFLDFLAGDRAAAVLARYGFGRP